MVNTCGIEGVVGENCLCSGSVGKSQIGATVVANRQVARGEKGGLGAGKGGEWGMSNTFSMIGILTINLDKTKLISTPGKAAKGVTFCQWEEVNAAFSATPYPLSTAL